MPTIPYPGLVRLGEEADPTDVALTLDDEAISIASPLPSHDMRVMDVLEAILVELKVMNAHLTSISGEEFPELEMLG